MSINHINEQKRCAFLLCFVFFLFIFYFLFDIHKYIQKLVTTIALNQQ